MGRIARQGQRALQEGGRRGETAARLRAPRRPLQLEGDGLVGTSRRRGQVPRPAIRVQRRIRRIREGAVDQPAVGRRGIPIDHGSDEGMAEPELRPNVEQPGGCRRSGRLRRDTQSAGGHPDEDRIADRLRGHHQQQPARVIRERRQASSEALLDPPRHRDTVGQAEATREGRR